ncbi:MAG: 5-(carboxyamino)imidazole ribonucleotide mutase [Selenomonadaceae bacterium]|nr:5-(carboxyamino)imidazole ribonucleotide mutase [Selenomonadaceae bacterium]
MKVAVIMGSDSDFPILKPATELLKDFGIELDVIVASAHRTPDKVREYVLNAQKEGIDAFIVAAGAAAHLAGVVASFTVAPVIGVPINATPMNGMDALLSTVQMPSGIPVATMAVNGAKNAAISAAEIFAVKDENIRKKLTEYREKMKADVAKKSERVKAQV